MDPLSVSSSVIQLISLARAVTSYTFSVTNRLDYIKLYGISGLVLFFFGSPIVWQLQARVLGSLDDKDALEFRKSMQDECTMTAVAVGQFFFQRSRTKMVRLRLLRKSLSQRSRYHH